MRQSGNIDEIAGDGTIRSCAYSVGAEPVILAEPILLLLVVPTAFPTPVPETVPLGIGGIAPAGVTPFPLPEADIIAGLSRPACTLPLLPMDALASPAGIPCKGVAK